jgi:hypothetical protein
MNDLQIFSKQMDIYKIEKACKEIEQVECPVEHEFAEGVYSRKMNVPAGTFVIGKMHKHSTYNILLSGSCSVYVGDGLPAKDITAPFTFTSEPMVKKMAFFHEDSVWINIHPTEETDLLKIEHEFIVPEENILDHKEILCLG